MQFPPGVSPVALDMPPIISGGGVEVIPQPPAVMYDYGPGDMGPAGSVLPPGALAGGFPPVASSIASSFDEDEDYSYWRYSRFAIPFLLLLLALFVTIFCLTAWQSRSDIRLLREGVPRDLEPPSTATSLEGGIPKWKRNMRIATTVLAIIFILIAFAIFLATLPPSAKVGANIGLGVLLIIVALLAILCFAFDVNSERDAEHCTANPTQRPIVCENNELFGTLITLLDILLALLLVVAGLCLIFYGKSGDWTKKVRDPTGIRTKAMKNGVGVADIPPGLFSNGVSMVRKWITSLALLAALATAVALLVMTILVHEDRNRLTNVDRYNRPINTPEGEREVSGWPRLNTKLRYALTALVIVTILLNLIPLNLRVVAYVFAFLYICYAILAFVAFGVDVDAIEDAQELVCPDTLSCKYHPYNAVAALEFIGGLLLIAYVAIEYFVCHKKKKAQGDGAAVLVDEGPGPIFVE